LGLANPYLLKLLIDEAIPQRDLGLLALYAGLMVVVPIINGGIGLAQAWLTASVGQFVMRDLRNALFTHVQSMPIRFFSETRTGEIQSRLTNDVSGVQSVVSDAAANLASSIAIVVSTLVAMTIIDWRLTAVSIAVAPLFLFLSSKASAARRKASGEVQTALADLTAIAEEHLSVGGALLAKSFGRSEAGAERFTKRSGELAALQLRQALTGRWVGVVVQVVFSGIPALVYFAAGSLSVAGAPDAPTIGDIVALHNVPECAHQAQRVGAQERRVLGVHPNKAGLEVPLCQQLAVIDHILAPLVGVAVEDADQALAVLCRGEELLLVDDLGEGTVAVVAIHLRLLLLLFHLRKPLCADARIVILVEVAGLLELLVNGRLDGEQRLRQRHVDHGLLIHGGGWSDSTTAAAALRTVGLEIGLACGKFGSRTSSLPGGIYKLKDDVSAFRPKTTHDELTQLLRSRSLGQPPSGLHS
jgi:hypothetical protein